MAQRRLLAFSYYYPPTASVGSVRIAALAKRLPQHGWDVTVVTPRREGRTAEPGTVVETEDSDLAAGFKRMLGLRPDAALKDAISGSASPASRRGGLRSGALELIKGVLAVPDANRGWIRIAERAAVERLERERFDAILSTSPPPSAHVAASRVAGRSGLPWVADLRDLWSQDHNSTAPEWRRRIDQRLEARIFRLAAALVTVSDPLARQLRQLHPTLPVRTILNGFDPDEVGMADRLTADLTLTHTGTFYQGRRDPTVLFESLAALVGDGRIPRDRIRVRLFARHEPWVAALVRQHGLDDVVELLDWTARREALRVQQESQVLLLLHWGGRREEGVYTGKVFEYLAARRPILMIGGGPGVLHDLLVETGAGVHVTDRASLERQLVAWWQELAEHGSVCWRGRADLLDRYSHDRMAAEFAELLDTMSASG
ncbi:MAG: glycosyltransferase [Deltaproteobacteria bacterium]|nr:glycosyltransferase [Deltaproteobacteria bacterium]MBW2531797.1 glycosyltransferase [Deltaproteobacteria bacterium]